MSGRFSQNDLVAVTRENEASGAAGIVVGSSRYRTYGTSPSASPAGNDNTSGIITGDGGVHSVTAGLRYANVEIPSHLVFGLNDFEWEDQMRDEWQADELAVAGSFGFDQAGTHVDGSTGPVITATAGTFDDIFDADHAGLMMEISGVAIASANKWPRPIKAVKSDGSQIDIEPAYASALVSAGGFREAMVTETGKAGTISLGRWLRNRGVQNIRSVNFEWENTDQPGGSYTLVKGCHGSGVKLSINGKGNVEVQFMYEGMDYNELATTTIAGANPVLPNPYIVNDVINSANGLAYFAIGGTTLLSGDNLTTFSLDGNGNASGIDDVSGNRFRAGVTVGDLDFTGSLKIYHKQVLSAVMVAYGHSGNKAPIDFKLADSAAGFYVGRIPLALFAPNLPKHGAKGSKTDNSINFKTQLGKRGGGTERTFILQRFAAA